MTTPPVVLVFAGNDPTGGAGIEADIQAIISMGCHPAPVVTAITVQTTAGVQRFTVVDAELVMEQARAILEDMPVAAFKTGMLGNSENIAAIASVVREYPDIPLIVDPVLASGGGDPLSDEPLEEALRTLLLPHAELVTPNSMEARRLAPQADTLDACAHEILSLGCEYVLVTGTHEATSDVVNRFYGHHRLLETFTWKRLPHDYHGSGCTLAAACAATFAHRFDPVNAVAEAQDYTWNTLKNGYRLGMGQFLPDRLFWARQAEERPQ